MTLAVYIQDVSQSSRRAMLQRPCNLDLLHYKVLTAFEFAKSKPAFSKCAKNSISCATILKTTLLSGFILVMQITRLSFVSLLIG